MSYLVKNQSMLPSTLSAQSLTSTADVQTFIAPIMLGVLRIAFLVKTATVSSGTIVVNFVKRPTIGSATGEVTLGTLNIPGAVAAGSVYYKDIEPSDANNLAPGQLLIARVATAAAGGGAAGDGFCLIQTQEDPEVPANNSSLVLSA